MIISFLFGLFVSLAGVIVYAVTTSDSESQAIKALEGERDRLKGSQQHMFEMCEDFKENNAQLKAENEKLKVNDPYEKMRKECGL